MFNENYWLVQANLDQRQRDILRKANWERTLRIAAAGQRGPLARILIGLGPMPKFKEAENPRWSSQVLARTTALVLLAVIMMASV